MFKGLSKEFKVGALTLVSLTVLILGYNYMVGKDNPFQRGREFYVFYDSTQGLSVGTSIVYNGMRIGQLAELSLVDDGQKVKARIEISSDLNIPKDSRLKIESELLGGQKIKLVRGRASIFAEAGDTLHPMYTRDQFSALNDKILPIATKADSLISSLNKFFINKDLTHAVHELPLAIASFKSTLDELNNAVKNVEPKINNSVDNFSKLSNDFATYQLKINSILNSLEHLGKQIDTVDVGGSIRSLKNASSDLAALLEDINKGNGTLGKLARDPKLYNDVEKSITELNRVLLDLKKYPEKYVPVPFTKSQRKAAKKKSLSDKQVWPDSLSKPN